MDNINTGKRGKEIQMWGGDGTLGKRYMKRIRGTQKESALHLDFHAVKCLPKGTENDFLM